MRRGLPIGVTPNVRVSLVLLPDECRELSARRFPLQSLKLKVISKVLSHRLDHARRAAAVEGRT